MSAEHGEDLVVLRQKLVPDILRVVVHRVDRLEVDRSDFLPLGGGIEIAVRADDRRNARIALDHAFGPFEHLVRSEEHTSELQSLMRISYAVFCLKKKKYSNIQYNY